MRQLQQREDVTSSMNVNEAFEAIEAILAGVGRVTKGKERGIFGVDT